MDELGLAVDQGPDVDHAGSALATGARAARWETPFLLMDPETVADRVARFRSLLPGVGVHYAMKCNPDEPLLRRVAAAGASFEIASLSELDRLRAAGLPVDDVIFSNPVKMAAHIEGAHRAGVRWFAFDSDTELDKIARHAPGAAVYIRLRTRDVGSLVPSEGKFGVEADQAVELMARARRLGLAAAGIGFHVGSQMLDPGAWTAAIEQAADLMSRLDRAGIRISMLDLGGGFPARYDDGETGDLEAIAAAIRVALARFLPHPLDSIVIEPGRGLVADAGIMVATIIGTATRLDTRWLHLDVGAFNGLMEALETANTLRFPMSDSRDSADTVHYHVTGPSCDSQDTILHDVALSADLAPGDRVFIHTAGAYTTCYASTFNGFAKPATRYLPI